MNAPLPTARQAKELAKRLRMKLADDGTEIGHGASLEMIAHQHGFRDWNTMSAALAGGPSHDWPIGAKVSGTYLSQPFTATVMSRTTVRADWVRLELHLDEAIDVVASSRFSNFRRRIFGVVGPKGHSEERTSDGQPQLQLNLLP
ncbi:glyoxalase superfamily protein [Celeribacter sp.]|uniref:glyoxalase superfamily protein n=1 Tax=Celeribacter sp. TaxID=1890673 RepID=UPI003A8F2682